MDTRNFVKNFAHRKHFLLTERFDVTTAAHAALRNPGVSMLLRSVRGWKEDDQLRLAFVICVMELSNLVLSKQLGVEVKATATEQLRWLEHLCKSGAT